VDIKVLLTDLDGYVSAMVDPLNTYTGDMQGVQRGNPSFGPMPEGDALKNAYATKQRHLFESVDAFGQAVQGFSTALVEIRKAYQAAEDGNVSDAELLLAVQQAFAGVNGLLNKRSTDAQVLG
jgi:hypothetical protein